MSPELKTFIDAAIVPALVERILRDHEKGHTAPATPLEKIDPEPSSPGFLDGSDTRLPKPPAPRVS